MGLPVIRGPAEAVDILQNSSQYDLLTIRAPRLVGLLLKVFVWIAESWICAPIRVKLMRDNKFPQILQETVYSEGPSMSPALPLPAQSESQLVVQDHNAIDRANVASSIVSEAEASSPVTKLPSRHWSAAQYQHAYQQGITTPSEVAERILRCIATLDSSESAMNFFISHNAGDVRKQAAEATTRYQEGRPLSVLDGVPYAVKDMMHAIPYETTCGTTYMASLCKAEKDHPQVAAMRATGAVLLGKTNLHELGVSPIGINRHYGIIRNPHAPDHYAGGSSSGSAGVVAAGLCPFAIGNDGGGSIRVPAACCGVVGLKPTWGRDPPEGSPSLVKTLVSSGPIASCVADALLMYAATANAGKTGIGTSVAPASIPKSLPSPEADPHPLHGKQLGIYWDWFNHAEASVVEACKACVDDMCRRGAQVVSVTLPELDAARVAHIYTFGSEAASAHTQELQSPALRKQLANDVRITLALASGFTAQQFLQAQRVRTRMLIYMRKIFESVDYMVTPTMPHGAPVIKPDVHQAGESDLTTVGWLMRFVQICNFTGYPAISLPIGHNAQGLPIGFQIIGRPWDEAGLFQAAKVVEDACKDLVRPPQVAVDLMNAT